MFIAPWPLAAVRAALCIAGALLLGACATSSPHLASGDSSAECLAWLQRLDQAVDEHAVRDGAAHRPAGFPFLRVNRLLDSFRDELDGSELRWQAWVEHLRALDSKGRDIEIQQLPSSVWPALATRNAAAAQARVRDCSRRLLSQLSSDPEQRERLRQVVAVPDDYSAWLRTLGVYPLTRWPFFRGVVREQALWQTRWDSASGAVGAEVLRYRSADAALASTEVARLLRSVPRDALGIPRPDPDTARRLLAAYAPVLEIETAGAHDLPGRLRWGQGPAPDVDTGIPVVYQRMAYTRFGNETLMQLVYSIWFNERPAVSALDLLAGPIDGLVLRLTLSSDGRVLLFDSIHGCGCYHVFVPSLSLRLKSAPSQEEWAFVPAILPAVVVGERLQIRVASSDHQVLGVTRESPFGHSDTAVLYSLEDDNSLRSLPTAEGGRRSAFWSNGIMPGTERGERVLFWPMGITSAGAMRQWGRHPTAFVGRRHFDDAHLIEQRFEKVGSPAGP